MPERSSTIEHSAVEIKTLNINEAIDAYERTSKNSRSDETFIAFLRLRHKEFSLAYESIVPEAGPGNAFNFLRNVRLGIEKLDLSADQTTPVRSTGGILFLYRVGSLPEKLNELPFTFALLGSVALSQNQPSEEAVEKLAGRDNLDSFLESTRYLLQLYAEAYERAGKSAEREMILRNAAARRLAELKEEELYWEEKAEARQEKLQLLSRLMRTKIDRMILLGQALIAARRLLEQETGDAIAPPIFLAHVFFGLELYSSFSDNPDADFAPYRALKDKIELIVAAFRWSRLSGELEKRKDNHAVAELQIILAFTAPDLRGQALQYLADPKALEDYLNGKSPLAELLSMRKES
jgi:hypothetical protein